MDFGTMKMKRILVLIFISVTISLAHAKVPPELISVNVIFRHGVPRRLPNKEEYMRFDQNTTSKMALTNQGKERSIEFGKYLGERYKHLLSSCSPNSTILSYYIRDISKSSLNYVISGLKKTVNLSNFQFNDIEFEQLLPPWEYNKKYQKELKHIQSFPIVHKHKKSLECFLYLSSDRLERNIASACDVYNMYMRNQINYSLKKNIPRWLTKPKNKEYLLNGTMNCYEELLYTKKAESLAVGKLWAEIGSNLVLAEPTFRSVFNITNFPLSLYSGYDINIVGLLKTLGNKLSFLADPPKYMDALIIEQYLTQEDNYGIKIFYKHDGAPTELRRVPIESCNADLCPSDDISKIIDKYCKKCK